METATAPIKAIRREDIVKSCVDNGFYRTPHCNDKLFLHHRGYDAVVDGAFDDFTEVSVLWLEGNFFSSVPNLTALPKLRMLYLHENCIKVVSGLETLSKLHTINLSCNSISRISGLEMQADCLETLQLKGNSLRTASDLEGLAGLRLLSVLDLSANKIEDPEPALAVLERLPALLSLHLSGNPCVRALPHYRRAVLTRLPRLRNLDERPVFDDERRLVAAWAAGGAAGEREEQLRLREEAAAAVRRRVDEFRSMRRDARREAGLAAESDSASESESDGGSGSGGGSADGGGHSPRPPDARGAGAAGEAAVATSPGPAVAAAPDAVSEPDGELWTPA